MSEPVFKSHDGEVDVAYDLQQRTAWISFICILLILAGLQALVWFGDAKPEVKQEVAIFLSFFPGSLILLSVAMFCRSKRRIQITDGKIYYHRLFHSCQLSFEDIQSLVWNPKGDGSVRFTGSHAKLSIPFYGLRASDVRKLILHFRQSVEENRQKGWNVFLYCICEGQLSGKESKQRVAKALSTPAQTVVAVLAPIVLAVKFAVIGKLVSMAVGLCLLLMLIVFIVLMLSYLSATRSIHVQRLAGQFVREHGDVPAFDA